MVLYNTNLRFSKKGALYDELPLFIISLGIISILMIGLHFLVVSQDTTDERASFEQQRFVLDGSFYLRDFLQQQLTLEDLENYPGLVGLMKSEQTLEFALRSNQKEDAQKLFQEKREEYLEEHREILQNYLEFYDSDFTIERLFSLGYFEVERLEQEYLPTTYSRNCVLSSVDMEILPQRSGAIFEELVVVSFSPISPFCTAISQGGVFR